MLLEYLVLEHHFFLNRSRLANLVVPMKLSGQEMD